MKLEIYQGRSRYDSAFTSLSITWHDLVKRLSETTRTDETVAEYKKFSKTKQDNIKDVGAFIGGVLGKGKRKDVKNRCLICLDADFADENLINDYTNLLGYAAVFYSTHKHTKRNPRLRLVIPLSRPIPTEQYEPVARKIAEILTIDRFDDTTYQAGRIMYWPSTSKDGEYLCEKIEGNILDPGYILTMYDDWTDASTWPVSSRQRDLPRRRKDKAEDPLSKPGIIGAFCRAYPVEEAIDKWIDDYDPSGIEGRYTYKLGSTVNGIVTYDHLWSYSFHDTDPASGQLLNAFDLVRVHKFGKLDLDAKPGTRIDRLPSYKAMMDMASELEAVKKEVVDDIDSMFGEATEATETTEKTKDSESPGDWKKELKIGKNGVIPIRGNIELILRGDPYFKGKLGHDLFLKRDVALCDLPWRKVHRGNSALEDVDDTHIRSYLEDRYGISNKEKTYDATVKVCYSNKFHPVRDYLDSLTWDFKPRLETMIIDYFAAEDNELNRALTRKFFVAAVKRIYEPGCHFDNMLVLKGPQGIGKSSFLRKISRGWFTDSIKDIRNKDALEGLQGVWICEMGELAALKKADAEAIKGFLSSPTDRFRPAYGRRTKIYPRECVFVATTNEGEFLRDRTGNRRFWIIGSEKGREPKKDVFAISDSEIDQIWAEAKYYYDNDLETVILSPKQDKQTREVQEAYMQEDPREAQILEFLDRKLPNNWNEMTELWERQEWLNSHEADEGDYLRDRVCARQIWEECLGNPDALKMTNYDAAEINKIVDRLPNWTKKPLVRVEHYSSVRGFVRLNKG